MIGVTVSCKALPRFKAHPTEVERQPINRFDFEAFGNPRLYSALAMIFRSSP